MASIREIRKKKILNKIQGLFKDDTLKIKNKKISELWGITTFFNPSNYQVRYKNYRKFRQNSKLQGLKLVAIELSFDGNFELKEGKDADILIKLKCKSVLWQKERLLNLALTKLPKICSKVCWIDADLIFANRNWVYQTSKLLDHYKVVQPFQRAIRLPQNTLPIDHITAKLKNPPNVAGTIYDFKLKKEYHTTKHCGYVWAIRRNIIDKLGFYDRNIIGGGDRVMCHAIFSPNIQSEREANKPNSPYGIIHAQDIKTYTRNFHALVKGDVCFTPGIIYHLWHGDEKNRQYMKRYQVLKKNNYNPIKDIKIGPNGCWNWSTDKTKLIQGVKDYFQSRKEDG